MIYYLLLPFFSILLIVLQTSIADIIFSGCLVLEISLIVVIYAGFRLNLVRGAILAFLLGFTFDIISGLILGLLALIYVLIFLLSFFMSIKLDTEKMHFIALFTLFCAFLEEIGIVLIYNLAYGFDIRYNTSVTFLSQVVIVSLLAPVFFSLMRRLEVFFYGKTIQHFERTGTGRIQAEA